MDSFALHPMPYHKPIGWYNCSRTDTSSRACCVVEICNEKNIQCFTKSIENSTQLPRELSFIIAEYLQGTNILFSPNVHTVSEGTASFRFCN